MDKRWSELANVMVQHSTGVKPGERVMIAMGELDSYPLARAVFEACIKAGAYPQVQFLSEGLRHAVMKFGSRDQVAWVPEIEAYGMTWADVYFGLRGAYNLFEHADIPASVLSVSQRAMGTISRLRWEKTRWCLVRIPNALFAQQAETDEDTLTEMFFRACLLDWEQAAKTWQAWADALQGSQEVHILGRGTDLRFSVRGRRWVVLDGRINMPDGEILTAPVNETLDGYISFELPGVFGGRLIPDIHLAWERGRLVEARASRHQDFLHDILATDGGSCLLGEFAFGLNPHVNRFCRDPLIDEKMGGTIHIALGRAYPECGGDNPSAIHWDIVKDMREEGMVLVDGKGVLTKGHWNFSMPGR